MKVSVIIPTFNSMATLRQCLDSVYSQDCNLEVILVDDWSSDATFRLAGEYVERHSLLYVTPIFSRQSAAAARNLGLDLATGDVIAFLDADDFWFPTKLRKQLATINSDYLGVCCDYLRVASFEHNCKAKYVRVPMFVDARTLSVSNPLCTSGLLLWRKAIGDTRFLKIGHEDYFFIYTLCAKTRLPIVSIQQPLVCYGVFSNSLSSNILRSMSWWVGVQKLIGNSRFRTFFNGFIYFTKAIRKRF